MTKKEAYELLQTMHKKRIEFEKTGDTSIILEITEIQGKLLMLPKNFLLGYKPGENESEKK